MASATAIINSSDSETCVSCSNKHHRTRPSFCQCKHCSIPLCFDCMKEHHEELLQDVEQISHQYNELQQLGQTKQTMIVDETTKSIEDVNRYFESYMNELRETQQRIIAKIERSKEHAQEHVRKINMDLRSVGEKIQGLAKESVVQTDKMKTVSTELKEIEQQLSTYQLIQTDNLIRTQPEFSITFDCPSVETEVDQPIQMEVNDTSQPDPQEYSSNKSDLFGSLWQFPVLQNSVINQTQVSNAGKGASTDSSDSDNDGSDSNDSHIDTSYDIDRMASDGENILYTSYYDDKPDRIAYCRIEDDDDDKDEHQYWKKSRIVDMIWWGNIGKFVCATEKGVYTVDHTNREFKSKAIIRGKWSFIRVPANTTVFFLWIKSKEDNFHGIEVYSAEFEVTKRIDFGKCRSKPILQESASFSVTDNLIASIYPREQNNGKVLEVTFFDMNMDKVNAITLDECSRNMEIRTDGNDRFFITTGRRSLHIVSSKTLNQTINLEHNVKRIAVLNDQRIAVSNGHVDLQIVPYSKLDFKIPLKFK